MSGENTKRRKSPGWRARRTAAWRIPAFALDETLSAVRQFLLRLSRRPDAAVHTGTRSGTGNPERAGEATWKKADRTARFIVVVATLYHREWVRTERPDRARDRRDTAALAAAQRALAAAAEAVKDLPGGACDRAEKAFAGFRWANVAQDITALEELLGDAADRMGRARERKAGRQEREGQAAMLARMVHVLEGYLERTPTQSELDELLKVVFGAMHGMGVKRPIQAALSGTVDKEKLLSPAALRELSEMLFGRATP